MSSSYFGNVAAAAAAAATGGWGPTTAATMPHHHHHHHHQEQFYLHQNCAKYGYSESQYYGHQYQHHLNGTNGPATTTTTPSPPFRYASHHGYAQPTVSFQCSTTLAPVKPTIDSSFTSPTVHLNSPASSVSSPSSSSASSDQQETANSSLYGSFSQHQLDSFQQQVNHHHRHSLSVAGESAIQQHHQQLTASTAGPTSSAGLNPLESSTVGNHNNPYDLHHRGIQSNLQQPQHHHQTAPYCIKNTNTSSYFPGWMQAYAGKWRFKYFK